MSSQRADIGAPQPSADWPTFHHPSTQLHWAVFNFPAYIPSNVVIEMVSMAATSPETSPSIWRWVIGFLLVGMAWGLTTPFMRKGALSKDQKPPPKRPILDDHNASWLKKQSMGVMYAVVDLLKNPAYAVPLLLNVTGSVWFFLLIGQAGKMLTRLQFVLHSDVCPELSLTVPITNSLAFLFTVLGEWWAEGKVISKGAKPTHGE